MLQKLLDRLHSTFDKSELAVPALFIGATDGATWKVGERKLTVGTDVTPVMGVLPLHGKTVLDVRNWLQSLGYSVTMGRSDTLHRPADALLEGSGREAESNGNKLAVYGSTLYAFMDAYAYELEDGHQHVTDAMDQMSIGTADAFWLDHWGNLFGVPRIDGETDDVYRTRIIVEVLRPRVNTLAIEKAVIDWTSHDVRIYEPWKDIFWLGQSRLDGKDHIQDGHFYTHNVIEPQGERGVRWPKVIPVIERNKAAGTLVMPPMTIVPTQVVNMLDDFAFGQMRLEKHTDRGNLIDWQILGAMRLDDAWFIFNTDFMSFTVRSVSNVDGIESYQTIPKVRSVANAAIALSDGAVLGENNAVLGRGRMEYVADPSPTVSDLLTLSDYTVTSDYTRVENITMATGMQAVAFPDPDQAVLLSDTITDVADSHPNGDWTGAWDSRTWLEWRFVGISMTSDPG